MASLLGPKGSASYDAIDPRAGSGFHTADHAIDCVFSYALFLASRCQDAYPKFGELHAVADATPRDLLDGLRAVTTMLTAVIVTADPDARAVIWHRPEPEVAPPQEFAPRCGSSFQLLIRLSAAIVK